MFSRLETNIEDPAERLKAIAEANSIAKQHSSAIGATLLQDWTQFAAPAVFGVAMRVYASSRLSGARPVHNLVVSNVPGPQMPLYMLGCQVEAMYPLGPIFHGSGLNITVMSLNGGSMSGSCRVRSCCPICGIWPTISRPPSTSCSAPRSSRTRLAMAASPATMQPHGSMWSHEAQDGGRADRRTPHRALFLVAGCSNVVQGGP